jgi:hypothetical protein
MVVRDQSAGRTAVGSPHAADCGVAVIDEPAEALESDMQIIL